MALEIIENKIVGTIDNIEDKLEGKLPINKLELIHLINSWGRRAEININFPEKKNFYFNR